jgi:hypothetical protein
VEVNGHNKNQALAVHGPDFQYLMTTILVDAGSHFGGKPLPFIDVAAMSKSHNHDQEHIIGNGVDNAIVAYAHPIARTTSQGPGCWRPRVVGK